jgi:hypothetical protein
LQLVPFVGLKVLSCLLLGGQMERQMTEAGTGKRFACCSACCAVLMPLTFDLLTVSACR